MSSTSSQWGASFGADNLFCPSCQNILNAPDADQIMSCSYCTQDVSFSGSVDDMKQTKIINSAASQFEQDEAPSLHKRATVEEPCPKCGHPELTFYTMQIRSVDEGQTVFYECPKCGHAHSTNN